MGLLAEGVDAVTGGAGWAGAGLLGLVLAWLLLVNLPARDKQMRELLNDIREDRDADRQARQALANQNQEALIKVAELSEKRLDKQLASFAERNRDVKEAIRDQTGALHKDTESLKSTITQSLAEMQQTLGMVCEASLLLPPHPQPPGKRKPTDPPKKE